MADPGFPRQGHQSQRDGHQPTYYLASFFPKNCIKIKEIGPGGMNDAYEVGTRRRVLQIYRYVDLSAMTIIITPDLAYVTRLQENR